MSRLILPGQPEPRPTVPLVGESDGGLARRLMFRQVKERMVLHHLRGEVTRCGLCVEQGAKNVRRYNSWDGMRTHTIEHHGIDPREVPE